MAAGQLHQFHITLNPKAHMKAAPAVALGRSLPSVAFSICTQQQLFFQTPWFILPCSCSCIWHTLLLLWNTADCRVTPSCCTPCRSCASVCCCVLGYDTPSAATYPGCEHCSDRTLASNPLQQEHDRQLCQGDSRVGLVTNLTEPGACCTWAHPAAGT